jgi:hypothetical protein
MRHPVVERVNTGLPIRELLGWSQFRGTRDVLGEDAVDESDRGRPTHQEHVGRPHRRTGVDGDGYCWVGLERHDLGRRGHGADHDRCAVPVESDGHHAVSRRERRRRVGRDSPSSAAAARRDRPSQRGSRRGSRDHLPPGSKCAASEPATACHQWTMATRNKRGISRRPASGETGCRSRWQDAPRDAVRRDAIYRHAAPSQPMSVSCLPPQQRVALPTPRVRHISCG